MNLIFFFYAIFVFLYPLVHINVILIWNFTYRLVILFLGQNKGITVLIFDKKVNLNLLLTFPYLHKDTE